MNKQIIYYLIYRLTLIFITIVGILFVNFMLINLLNINPLEYTLHYALSNNFINHKFINIEVSPQLINYLKNYFYLYDNFFSQFLHTSYQYLTLNLGRSFYNNQDVAKLILVHIKSSIGISFISTLLIYSLSVLIAYILIVNNNLTLHSIIISLLLILYLIPTFYFANVFKLFFKSYNLFFAILCNTLSGLWLHSFFIKNLIQQEIKKTYYTFLFFNNQKPKIFKNIIFICMADLPFILIYTIFGSSVIVEIIFNINGIGLLIYHSFLYKDYPVILGIIFVMSLLGLMFRLFNDLLLKVINKKLNLY